MCQLYTLEQGTANGYNETAFRFPRPPGTFLSSEPPLPALGSPCPFPSPYVAFAHRILDSPPDTTTYSENEG